MAPPPRCCISGSAARAHSQAPRALTLSVQSQWCAVSSVAGAIHARGRVVDQDVQIPEALLNKVEQVVDFLFRRRYCRAMASACTPSARASAAVVLGGVGVADVVDQHVRAAAGQLQHDGAADAAPTAGDQGQLALQVASVNCDRP